MKKKQITYYNRWLFRIIMLLLISDTMIAFAVLPKEKDSTFVVDTAMVNDSKDDTILYYRGTFEWVKEDGTREAVEAGATYDVPLGETFVVESTIPLDFKEPAIIIRSSQQNMKIYIAGDLRINYDTENTRPVGTQTTSRFVICPTSNADAGKVIRIETISNAEGYSGIMNQVFACDRYDFWKYILNRYGSDAIYGLLIMAIGLFTIGVSLALTIGYKHRFNLEFIGWGVFLAGTWLAGESKLRQLLVPNGSVLSNICFLVIMLAPFPLCIYMDSIQKSRYKRFYNLIEIMVVVNFVLSNILQIFKICNYIDLLSISHLLLLVAFVTVVTTMIIDAKRGMIKDYRNICIGLMVLMGAVLFECISVYFVTMVTGPILSAGVLFFVGSAIYKTIKDIRLYEIERQEAEISEQKKQAEYMSMQMIQTLSDTLEAKDEYTRGHAHRVAEYSAILARKAGMTEDEVSRLHYAATLHDIGKIGIPDTILNKPGKLTDEEYAIIKTHTVIGADIIKKVELISYAEKVARYHHERYDGRGYPEGLGCDEIPYEARIVAICDAYDAMSSRRIYRNPLTRDNIRREIQRNIGTQFDPELTNIFLELLDEGAFDFENENTELVPPFGYEKKYAGSDDANKVLSILVDTMSNRPNGEDTDFLTGLPMRGKGEKLIAEKMSENAGVLVFFDMDNLKKINDVYGHKAGDKALSGIGKTIASIREDGIACRIGGDEFLLHLPVSNEDEIIALVKKAIENFEAFKADDSQIKDASLSAGICLYEKGDVYAEVLSKADKALYYVKHRGKAGYHIFNEEKTIGGENAAADLDKLMISISQSGSYEGAMELEYREFAKMYEYLGNLCERYKHTCELLLVTLDVKSGTNIFIDEIEQAMQYMEAAIRENIRTVDICTRYSSVQFFVILLEPGDTNTDMIMSRIFARFHKMCAKADFEPSYEVRKMV